MLGVKCSLGFFVSMCGRRRISDSESNLIYFVRNEFLRYIFFSSSSENGYYFVINFPSLGCN